MSPAEAGPPSPARASSRRSASSRPRSVACSSTTRSSRASRRWCAQATHGSSASSGTAHPTTRPPSASTRSACCPGWTALRDSITLTVHYGTPLDMSGSTVIGLSQSGQTPDVVEYSAGAEGRRVHGRGHQRRGLGARAGGGRHDPRSRPEPELAVAATKTYVEHARGARAARGPHRRPRRRDRRRAPRGRGPGRSRAAGARAARRSRLALPFAYTGRMFVIGRGVEFATAREIALKLLETCRDRRRAADRDRPRARPGRRARPAVPGLGDRLGRRDARAVVQEAAARAREDGRDARRERHRGRGIDGAAYRCPSRRRALAALPAALGDPGPAVRLGARARQAASTPTRRTASRRSRSPAESPLGWRHGPLLAPRRRHARRLRPPASSSSSAAKAARSGTTRATATSIDRRPLVRERRLRPRRDRRRRGCADAQAATPTRTTATSRSRPTTDLADRISRDRADGRCGRLLHERRRRVDRDRRQARAPLLEPRRPARAHGDHLARARLSRPRRLRHEHRRHGRVQGRCRPARRRHRQGRLGLAEALEATILELGPEHVAAFFCEPIIGAGGVLLPPDGYLAGGARDLPRARGALRRRRGDLRLRTRRRLVRVQPRFGLEPDAVTFAKGITSGYVPLGGVIVGTTIQEPFWSSAAAGVWRHGYTYSGHASAAAAAHANLDIIEREGLIARGLELEAEIPAALEPLLDHELVTEIRGGHRRRRGGADRSRLARRRSGPDRPRHARSHASTASYTRTLVGGGLQISPPLVITRQSSTRSPQACVARSTTSLLRARRRNRVHGKSGPGIPVVALAERRADVGVARDAAPARDQSAAPKAPHRDPVPRADVGREPRRPLDDRPAVGVVPAERASGRAYPASSIPIELRVATARMPGDVLLAHALDDAVGVDAVVRRHLGGRVREPPRADLAAPAARRSPSCGSRRHRTSFPRSRSCSGSRRSDRARGRASISGVDLLCEDRDRGGGTGEDATADGGAARGGARDGRSSSSSTSSSCSRSRSAPR